MPHTLEIILGPTAVGKTGYAIARALEVGVISCDSRQIYEGLSIGTAAPSREELAAVQHYFIGTVPVTRNYTAGIYEMEALELVGRLFAQGHEHLVMCGGSMLYIDAFCYGLDDFPEVPLQLRRHLMDCLQTEGVEVLAQQLKELDPVSYEELDMNNGQRVVRALEVSMYTGQPFSSFKTRSFKQRDFTIVRPGRGSPRHAAVPGFARSADRGLPRILRVLRRQVRPGNHRPAHPGQHTSLCQAPAHLVAPGQRYPLGGRIVKISPVSGLAGIIFFSYLCMFIKISKIIQ